MHVTSNSRTHVELLCHTLQKLYAFFTLWMKNENRQFIYYFDLSKLNYSTLL